MGIRSNKRRVRVARIPTVPNLTSISDEDQRALQQWMNAVKENLEIRTGRAGNEEKGVNRHDIAQLGMDLDALESTNTPYNFENNRIPVARYDDMRMPVSSVKLPASGAPTWTAYKGSYVLSFSKSQTNTIYFVTQLPHAWKYGSEMEFHIHSVPKVNASAPNDVARWTLTYSWADINGVFPAETTVTTDVSGYNVADTHMYSDVAEPIDASGKTLSSMMLCSLSRVGGNAADTYDDEIYLLEADFHIQIDKFGSIQERTNERG